MWGNTLGWCISVALLIGMGAGVLYLNGPLDVSVPTEFGRDANNLGVLSFTPVSPHAVVPVGDTGDAGPLYRNAITDYQKNHTAYETFASRGGSVGEAA